MDRAEEACGANKISMEYVSMRNLVCNKRYLNDYLTYNSSFKMVNDKR